MTAVVSYSVCFVVLWLAARTQNQSVDARCPGVWGFALCGALASAFIKGEDPMTGGMHDIVLALATVAAITDLFTGYVFDIVTGLAAMMLFIFAVTQGTLPFALEGAFAGCAPLLLLYTMTKGRGFGMGDVKLGCAAGLGTGAIGAVTAIVAAFVIGALWSLCALARGASRRQPVAFAPFMAAGIALSLLLRSWTWRIG